jgi:ribosome maturation protein Sdo1
MGIQQLTYTPTVSDVNEHVQTMVIMVDTDMLGKYKKDKSIALAEVVDSFDVLKFESGRSGHLSRPSKSELKEIFGTSNDDEVVKFMLQNGSLHGSLLNQSKAGGFPKGNDGSNAGTRS